MTILPKKQQPRTPQKPAPITIKAPVATASAPASSSPTTDPQLKSLEAENKQLRMQLYQATRAGQPPVGGAHPLNAQGTPAPPKPAATAAPAQRTPTRPPAHAQQQNNSKEIEILKSRVSQVMHERDRAMMRTREIESTMAGKVPAQEKDVLLERIRQLEGRLNEQKPGMCGRVCA